jgi:hypothetical protein
MDKIAEFLNYIACLLRNSSRDGYGDGTKSKGESTVTGTDYTEVCVNADFPCVLMLRVTGAQEVEIACSSQGVGFPLPEDTPFVLDKFKGRLYARSTAGASSLAWYIIAKNVTD